MTGDPQSDLLHPRSLVIPKVTEAVRDLMVAEEGTLIYNLDTNKLNICDVNLTAGATSWSLITSD